MRDETTYDRPYEPCSLFEPGLPEAKPMRGGYRCGGMRGQPCRRCLLFALGMDQAEFLATGESNALRKAFS